MTEDKTFDIDLFDSEKDKKVLLTPFQEHFCQLYVNTNNATQSYIEAYSCEKYGTAKSYGPKLLNNPKIKARISQLQNQVSKKAKITREDLIRVNVEVAFSKLSDVIEIIDGEIILKDDGDIDSLDAISFSKNESHNSTDKSESSSKSTSISVKRPDRTKATQEIAKLIGAYDSIEGNNDDKKNAALKLLEALGKFKKKDDKE